MNRTAFSLPASYEYRTRGGLSVMRTVEQFSGGASRLDDLIDLLDRRPGVVLSSGTTVPGRYESFDLGFSDPPLRLVTKGSDFALEALNARGEVLIAFLGDTLREPCVVVTEKNAARLAGHILRGAAPVDEDQRTRRASVMSLVRDLVAAFGANDDPLLGLFGAFAYDLVFQIEDLVQKRPREKDQRDIVLYVPDRLLAYDRATGRGVVLSYDFAWKGKSSEGLPRETAESVLRENAAAGICRSRARRISGHGGDGARRLCARRPVRGGAGAIVRRALRANAGGSVSAAVPDQSVALRRADESRRGRVSGFGVAGDVRALRRQAGRDLSDLRHHRARRRRDRRCRADPAAPEFGKRRIRTQHVHRRRPQRQGARLRARHHQGAGAAADRDLLKTVSHRRPCRGHAAAGLRFARRLPHPRLGGDGDRRAEIMGDAVRRGPRALVAALVCRRDRRGEFRRQHQYRSHHPHHPDEGRACRSAGRRHLPV